MKWKSAAAILFIGLSAIAATEVAPSKTELAVLYQKAEKELQAGDYPAALKELDAIETRQPGIAAIASFRGVVLTRQGDYGRAEAALRKALEIDPHLWSAQFNLAEISFLRKDWAKAGEQLAALRERVPAKLADAMIPLVDYKILLTVLFRNENEKAAAILNKLQGWEKSPAFDYAEAAIAFHRGKPDAGKNWIAAAENGFTAQENKMFRESFYQVGWLPRPAGESPALARFASADKTDAAPPEADADLQEAQRAYDAGDFTQALKLLDASPETAAAFRLRAEILLEQNKFSEAEAILSKATSSVEAGWETELIRARISLGQKDYADARSRLEALLRGQSGILQPEITQLIRYQMFLTLLLEGEEGAAQQTMDQFQFTDQTPALYYAQAAWNFQHDNPRQARQWIDSAKKLFSEKANSAFARTLPDLGSLGRKTSGAIAASAPPPVAASKPAEKTPAPAATAGEASPAPSTKPETGSSGASSKKVMTGERARRKPKAAKSKVSGRTTSAAGATPIASPLPIFTPTPTPTATPPFMSRLARTLLHGHQQPTPETRRREPRQPPGSESASPTATPGGRP